MTERVLNARVSPSPEPTQEETQDVRSEVAGLAIESLRPAGAWNPEFFAREQIRGLVRQVFFSDAPPVRQVVFSAVEGTGLRNLCRAVGETLAAHTQETVAVVGGYPSLVPRTEIQPPERVKKDAAAPLRQIAARVRGNLWLVPDGRSTGDLVTAKLLHAYLAEVRRQFEYSIVEAPPAKSEEATALAQFADGIILVLSAHHTRRAAACQIKAALEAADVRILGAVLSDRVFPIPEAIYRRL